ncbi:DEAD/DEAH box helicase family protein [Nocardioides ginkgobilobae]
MAVGQQAGRPPLRTHQRLALTALEQAWASGRRRAWTVLPPGAGKTRVGLETAEALLASGEVERVVVLGPNTAIVGQWEAQAAALDLALTAWTYQAVALFDPDAEVDEQGEEQSQVARLHENGRARVEELRAAGPLLLVLDECHHLLEVWGRLLAELLADLPDARVLGLTATPPAALTREQAELVDTLFGGTVFEASIPAVVREGDLAPFAELVWLVPPTPHEAAWVDSSAERFAELVAALADPSFGSVPFLEWLDRRLVERSASGAATGADASWARLAAAEPGLADAALRLHHAGMLTLPPGARPTEEHRRDPSADDWVLLVGDWATGHLLRSEDPADAAALEGVRRALPAVGHVLTRNGVRRGRSPIDRVLARSEAKTHAAVEIARVEQQALGERRRLLVLCDHESATATLPVDLRGVLSEQAGSAHAVLAALVSDPAGSDALLVTGSTVAGGVPTLEGLVAHVATTDAGLAASLRVSPEPTVPGGAVHRLEGPWTSRRWVPHVTRFLEQGGTTVLVGTRGLLGEGWDARSVSGLVDLTSVTTTTAVVQTRGRALRTDPTHPDKVAVNWSVVCVSDRHPQGDRDWLRLVRKHAGFFGVDADGEVVDGVGHIDPAFSPYAAPPDSEVDAVNARMVLRAEDRAGIRERWRVGEPYADRPGRTVRVRPRRAGTVGTLATPVPVAVRLAGLEPRPPVPQATPGGPVLGGGALLAGVLGPGLDLPVVALVVLTVALVAALLLRRTTLAGRGRALVAAAAVPPSVEQVAGAVADALHDCGLVGAGAAALAVEVDASGEYRCRLAGVPEPESEVFARALDEALGPVLSPRYVVPRHLLLDRPRPTSELVAAARGRLLEPDGTVWHPVPTVLGVRAERAAAYARAFDHWVGGGEALYTGSPEGAGVLAAQRGSDPFDVATVMRRHWT